MVVIDDVPAFAGRNSTTEHLAREIRNAWDHGLSPMEAIRAGTINGARLLGLQDEIGTVEAGKRADLVLVDGVTDLVLDLLGGLLEFALGLAHPAGQLRQLGAAEEEHHDDQDDHGGFTV